MGVLASVLDGVNGQLHVPGKNPLKKGKIAPVLNYLITTP
jgi:hypothetical protein